MSATASAAAPASAWTRSDRVLAAGLLGVGLIGLTRLVHPWFDPTHDAAMYLQTARSLANGDGYTYLGQPFQIRVPGFSAMIAPIVAVRGYDFHALNLFVAGFGVALMLALYAYARPRLGGPLAALSAFVVWSNPGVQRFANQTLSDVPGAALLVAALLVARWADLRPSWRREVVLGIAIGAFAWVRTAIVLLVPAVALARLLRPARAGGADEPPSRRAARSLIFAAVTGLVLLPWSVHTRANPPPLPLDQVRSYDYATALLREDPGDPSSPGLAIRDVLGRVPERSADLTRALGSRLATWLPDSGVGGSGVRAAVTVALIGALLVAGVRRREAGELVALANVGLLLVYFDWHPRLALPVFVLAIPALVEGVRDGVARFGGRRAGVIAAGVVLAALVASDAPRHVDWGAIADSHRARAETAGHIDAAVRSDARLASLYGYPYGIYLERPVYSLAHAMRRAGGPRGAEAVIDRYGLDTVVLGFRPAREVELARYLTARYGPPEASGRARIWRVRP